MPKTPEYFIARKNKRKTLEKYLPEDIQLIYGSSINPAKWNFGGELMARRELRTEADQIFYGALSKYRHRKSTDEDFENLGQETLQNKKEVSFLLITGQQLAQGLESYANNGRWSDYALLLVKMAELGKATGQQLAQGLERCANNGRWSDYALLLVKMAELGKIDFKNNQYLRISKHIRGLPSENHQFAVSNIASLLRNGQSLLDFHKETGSYQTFLSLRETGLKINETITDETKRINDPSKWWQDQAEFFGSFLALNNTLAPALIRDRLAGGIPALNGHISVWKNPVSDPASFDITKKVLDAGHFKNPPDLGKFLEIANAYLKFKKLDALREIVEKGGQIISKASRKLLALIAGEVGISEDEISDDDLSAWRTEFLPNLVSNDQMMEARGMDAARELYRAILKATFRNKFRDFISNPNQEDQTGRDVARHNKAVRDVFLKNSINYEGWLDYKGTTDFLVSAEVKVDRRADHLKTLAETAQGVLNAIAPLKEILTNREYEPLTHLLTGSGHKKGIKSLEGQELKTKLQTLEERLTTIKNKLEQKLESEYSKTTWQPAWDTVYEYMGHLREAVNLLDNTADKKTESREKGFRIKLWDRDPKKDLFEGNYSQCCIAVGVKDAPPEGGLTTHDPSTVMQFLADTGINVAEIYDQEWRNPIGNAWLFISKNELGEPILVIDNVEIHKDYTADPHIKRVIRENLFRFLAQFSKDIGLAGAGLGLVFTNDIPYDDLPRMNVPPVDSISGYLKEYTSDIGGRTGRYYFEAYNHNRLGGILPEYFAREAEKETNLPPPLEIPRFGSLNIIELDGRVSSLPLTQELVDEIVSGRSSILNQNDLDQIEEVENKKFGTSAQPIEEVLDTLANTLGVQFLIKENGKIVGYLSSRPADTFIPNVRHDSYDGSSDVLYVESVAGKTDPFQLLNILKQKAREAGYRKISMHGINPRLNRILARLGFELKEKIPDWLGHTAAYMEFELRPERE